MFGKPTIVNVSKPVYLTSATETKKAYAPYWKNKGKKKTRTTRTKKTKPKPKPKSGFEQTLSGFQTWGNRLGYTSRTRQPSILNRKSAFFD